MSTGPAPVVARLRVFPFKALDGADVAVAALTAGGGLRRDRAFAIVDESGVYVNGKREPRVHELRVVYDSVLTAAAFASPRLAEAFRFTFDDDPCALARWLSRHFERPVGIVLDEDGGFPDDRDAPGPTIVSRATLTEIASWFHGLDAEAVRLRLRANVELDGVPAFWEDGLYGAAGPGAPFRIGEVVLEATNPCARCIVPSRDPQTGRPIPAFAKIVADRRAATLPTWVERTRFDHFYRLAVNTRPTGVQASRTIRIGDPLRAG